MMSQEQVKNAIQIVLPSILMYFVGKGWISTSQVADITGAVIILAMAGWSIATHSKTALVANVNAMPDVKGVITTNDEAGHDLAAAIPSPTVVAAGTADAAHVAK